MSTESKQSWKDRGIGALFAFTISLVMALLTIAPDRAAIAEHGKAIPAIQDEVKSLQIAQSKDDVHWIEVEKFMKSIDERLKGMGK